jgi:hypothetical protein
VLTPKPQSPSTALARKCDCGNHASGGSCAACAEEAQKKKRVARLADRGGMNATDRGGDTATPAVDGLRGNVLSDGARSSVHEVVRGPGQRLSDDVRSFMEPRFGADFSDVRVHADADAARSSQAVSARAYTVGSHIVLGQGQYAPGTQSGQRLLAHELTHVVQQRQNGSGSSSAVPQTVSDPAEASEREADTTAERVLARQPSADSQPVSAPSAHSDEAGVSRTPLASPASPHAPAIVHRSSTLQRDLSDGAKVGIGIGAGLGAIGLGFAVAAAFGAFDAETYSTDDLLKYLDTLAAARAPEGTRRSDNKARDVVRKWVAKDPKIDVGKGHTGEKASLTSVELKRLLIREMLLGSTGDADEQQILVIIERTEPTELLQVLDPAKGLAVQDIDRKFDGEERDQLLATLDKKFPQDSPVRAQQPKDSACNGRDAVMVFHARERAIQLVDNAIAMLATPDDPAVQETLACRFRGASDAQVAKIKSVFERVRTELPIREYYCVGGMGSLTKTFDGEQYSVECVGAEAESFGYTLTEQTPTGPKVVEIGTKPPVALCDKFFTSSGERQATTIIHESVHAAGFGKDQTYMPPCGLAPSEAMTICDSYALFASELFERKGTVAAATPATPATTPASTPAPGGKKP